MAEIAVVIPAYLPTGAHLTWLGECLASVFAQTFTDWEMALVFDGCVGELDRTDSRVKVLASEDRQGPGNARNSGVRATSAPWLLFLDADDKLKPDALERLYAARNEEAVVYGDLDWIGERSGHERLVDFSTRYLREFSGPQPITALHDRRAWQLVGGFTPHLDGLEDLEYWIKLAEVGICGQRIDATILEYRQHGDSRQKQLEVSGRIHAVTREIRERHSAFFGGQDMGCSNCPGQPGMNPATPPPPAGTVAMRYQGAREGSFQTPPLANGNRYLVEGKGAFVYVKPEDVQHMLLYMERGGPMFAVIEQARPATPAEAVPVVRASKLFEKLTLAPAVTDITGLSVKKAEPVIAAQTSPDDLRVMRQMEKASQARVSIFALIDARLKELGGE